MTQYYNFTDEHVPVPTRHAPRLHEYQAYGGLRRGSRFVLSEHADRDKAQSSGAFIMAGESAPVDR